MQSRSGHLSILRCMGAKAEGEEVKFITGQCPGCGAVVASATVCNPAGRQADITEFLASGLLVRERDCAPELDDHLRWCPHKKGPQDDKSDPG